MESLFDYISTEEDSKINKIVNRIPSHLCSDTCSDVTDLINYIHALEKCIMTLVEGNTPNWNDIQNLNYEAYDQ